MTIVGCLQCRQWYDLAKPHVCGVLGDETARRLEERLDAFERRLQGLELEARSRLNRLEAAQAQGELDCRSPSADTRVKTLAAAAPSRVRIVLPSPDQVHDARLDDEPRIAPEPRPASDRKARHARYMRQWRLQRAMRKGDVHA
jgi:hypothetical protein